MVSTLKWLWRLCDYCKTTTKSNDTAFAYCLQLLSVTSWHDLAPSDGLFSMKSSPSSSRHTDSCQSIIRFNTNTNQFLLLIVLYFAYNQQLIVIVKGTHTKVIKIKNNMQPGVRFFRPWPAYNVFHVLSLLYINQ